MRPYPFHLAFPVHDLAEARRFYGDILGCSEGRSDAHWVDFNLYGHQIVAHLSKSAEIHRNPVDGDDVPVPHFGIVLDRAEFDALAGRLKSSGVTFEIEPHIRFKGSAGEQATMFLFDPSGNALEFKSMRDPNALFAKD